MRNQKSLVLIVAAIILFSFAAVPPANAFIGTATIAAILAVTFAWTVLVTETIKSNDESITEHSASKKKTQDNLQALNEP